MPPRPPIWYKFKFPSNRPCVRCGLFAVHGSAKNCLDEMRAEREALLKVVKQRERHGGVYLGCCFCGSDMEQLRAAESRKDMTELRRVYWCPTCRECLVTRESPSMSSLYVLAGLQKPNTKNGEPGMLRWDDEAIRRIMGDVYDPSSDPPEDDETPPGGW